MGFRAHNTNVYPERSDRVYLAYLDAGIFILDIADMANPEGRRPAGTRTRPIPGFSHTVLPIFDRDLLIVDR